MFELIKKWENGFLILPDLGRIYSTVTEGPERFAQRDSPQPAGRKKRVLKGNNIIFKYSSK